MPAVAILSDDQTWPARGDRYVGRTMVERLVTVNDVDDQKRRAAERAVTLVEDGMLLGLGSGSTAEWFVRLLGPRIAGGLHVKGVATSLRTERVACEVGLPLVELDREPDLAVDGADAIERGTLAAIKGHGGALTREKLVALASRRFVLIGDRRKLRDRLPDVGQDFAVPVEVLEFGCRVTIRRLANLGNPTLRERDGAPFRTDNGNLIVDLTRAPLDSPARLAGELDAMPGVVDHGLFLGIATLAIVATADDVIELLATT
jgi:ribose 5-phosphate isomerase A